MRTGISVSWKDILLYVCKWAGLFRLSRYLTRGGVRILCYHGFGTGEEIDFRPGTFIRPETFRARLQLLRSARYDVVSLQNALDALDSDRVTDGMTVITVDDLFYGFYLHAAPLLNEYGMPATGYLTTYYCLNREPVFRLLVRFIFWKTLMAEHVDFRRLHPALTFDVDLHSATGRLDGQAGVIRFGEALPTEQDRTDLVRQLAMFLDVDCSDIVASRAFSIVNTAEARDLIAYGIDLQLHTHRHRLPTNEDEVRREIEDNRRVLEQITSAPLRHFCYPSGIWSDRHWKPLESVGVDSATTCDTGLNYRETPRLALRRILDAQDVPQIAFEAEIAGFKPLLRQLFSR